MSTGTDGRASADARAARRALALLAAVLLAGGVSAGTGAGWMAGKSFVAQRLLERAWRSARTPDGPARPWPWADIAPVARLEVPSAGLARIVLQDVSGEAMAFGPGLIAGDPTRAAATVVALGGHRDSHLAFLERLPLGASLVLEDREGRRHAYRLASTRVVDSRDGPLSVPSDRPALVLVTCWPFHATQTGGPLRLVAVALPTDVPTDETGARVPVGNVSIGDDPKRTSTEATPSP